MNRLFRRPLGALTLFSAAACALPGTAAAAEGPGLRPNPPSAAGYWRLVGSPFSQHFRYSDEHRPVWALGAEYQRGDDWLAGGSYFSNSFGQPSAYVYVGKRFPALFGQQQLFGQLSGGLMYGYRGAFQNKVPLNYNGFSPGALVSLGWQFDKRFAMTAHMLGDAAIMLQLSFDLR